jgi:hypothetical protein
MQEFLVTNFNLEGVRYRVRAEPALQLLLRTDLPKDYLVWKIAEVALVSVFCFSALYQLAGKLSFRILIAPVDFVSNLR